MKCHSYIFSSSAPKNVRLFLFRLCVLVLSALSFQFAIHYWLDESKSKLGERKHAEKIGFNLSLSDIRANNADGLDVLYFGDSTALYIPSSDSSPIHEWTGRLLASKLKDHRVQYVSSAGLRFDVYDLMYRYSASTTDRIGVLVIPINIRSFSPPWLYDPALQFRRFKTALILGRHDLEALVRPVLSFNAMKSVAPTPKELRDLVGDAIQAHRFPNSPRFLAQMHYGFAIPRDHPLLESIRSIDEATRPR